jgi:hypothetical protein
MTVVGVANKANYIGLSTDTKPTSVPPGALFRESDTGAIFVYDGTTWVQVSSGGLTPTSTSTLTNKTIDATLNPINNLGEYHFDVYLGADSLYKCRNRATGAIDSSNSDFTTVLNYAIANISTNGAIYLRRGTYLASAKINAIDKSFVLVGEKAMANSNIGANGDTIIKANYTGGAGTALFDLHNTTFVRQQIKNVIIDCNSTVPIGIDAFDVRERYPWLESVSVFNATDAGILIQKVVYATAINLVIGNCTNYGFHAGPVTGGYSLNTFYVWGGRFTSNGINIYIESGGDFGFNTVVLEGATTSSVKHDAGVNFGRYRDCSFEWNPVDITKPAIDESGNNNTYDNCRFDSFNTSYDAIILRSTSRNIKFINNNLQANNANTTATIRAEAGATGVISNNTQNTNTPLTVTFVDGTSGAGFLLVGNSFTAPIQSKYQDLVSIAAPANPSASMGRLYVKQIDSNNDGLFIQVKKAGGFVEVQIA